MMGHNHAATGALVGVLTLPWAPSGFLLGEVAWVVACAGAALLPDLDTAHSKAGRMWGPVSAALASLVGFVARGHRQGTHDLILAPLVAAGLAWVAAGHRVAVGILVAVLVGLCLQALGAAGVGRVSRGLCFLLSAAAGWWLSAGQVDPRHLALVVALGVALHVLGDLPTTGGVPVPVAWLFGVRRRLTLGLFAVGGPVERWAITPALALSVLAATFTALGWW